MSETFSRDFKGIWIPKEIWLDTHLSYFDKLLWAEIDSLDGLDHCFASNEYFARFFNAKEKTISEGITRLKRLGYIFQVSFDGRKRVLSTKTTQEKFEEADSRKSASLISGNPLVSHIYKNKEYNKETPIVPKGDVREAFGDVIRLSKEEHAKAIELCGQKTFEEIVEEMTDYCKAHGKKYKDYLAAIRNWHRKRAKDPKNQQQNALDKDVEWAKKVHSIVEKECRMRVYPDKVVFLGYGPTPDIVICIKERGFREQVLNRIRKMGLDTLLKEFKHELG